MDVMTTITRGLGKAKLWTIKKSPELLLAGGLVAGGACVYFACKSTLKASELIDIHNERMDEIRQLKEIHETAPEDVSEQDIKVNTVRAYRDTAIDFVKEYAPAVIFGALSVTMILSSHGIMRKRNAALAATLLTVRTAFDEYRGRVIRDLGEEKDRHFLYDTVEETHEIEVTDDEGKTKKKKEKVTVATKPSCYSRFFDETCDDWTKDGSANYVFIRSQILYLQNKLIKQGYLFLNDVYKQFGLPITIAGQSAGWLYDYENRDKTGFAVEGFDPDEVRMSREAMNLQDGVERSVLLNFLNVRDNILDDISRVSTDVAVI